MTISSLTVLKLRKNLFETPYAHALLAFTGKGSSSGEEAIGLALYFFNYSTWTGKPGLYVRRSFVSFVSMVVFLSHRLQLEDLFVKPAHRSLGVGKALFGELGRIAEEKDCARLDWAVLKVRLVDHRTFEKR